MLLTAVILRQQSEESAIVIKYPVGSKVSATNQTNLQTPQAGVTVALRQAATLRDRFIE